MKKFDRYLQGELSIRDGKLVPTIPKIEQVPANKPVIPSELVICCKQRVYKSLQSFCDCSVDEIPVFLSFSVECRF